MLFKSVNIFICFLTILCLLKGEFYLQKKTTYQAMLIKRLEAQNQLMLSQASKLSEVLAHEQLLLTHLEGVNSNVLLQLHSALAKDYCSGKSVPNDVIWLQRNEIEGNTVTSDKSDSS